MTNKSTVKKPRRTRAKISSTPIKVVYESYVDITREGEYNDPFDSDDTATNYSISGIQVAKTIGDFSITFPVVPSKEYYLLYAVYNTGDSFHHAEDGAIEFIDLFQSPRIAEHNRDILLKARDGISKVTLTRQNGSKYSFTIPWDGYFESLSYVLVDEVELV